MKRLSNFQLLRLTTEKRKEFVTEGDEFQLSCIAHGYQRPVFVWTKDGDYRWAVGYSVARLFTVALV